ncbi:hypothetical protein SASPL_126810 [Salvia splendens]|uniref:Pectin acetylesterase n=1 Tax=Salvia splendens TaxID=180675 RepID=A0A8X8ZQD3_SALSN|nr:hypothetical protein SASPL_126810 [Salvia splendens]
MATLLLPLTILSLVAAGIVAGHNVTISLLDSAIAKGAVVPTKPTDPRQLRRITVSQNAGSAAVLQRCFHLLLCYNKGSSEDSGWLVAGQIKESLGIVLQDYPLLAGKLRWCDADLEIVCTDSGTRKVETKAEMALAVCLDGIPPAYAYSPGFGDRYDNWHVFLEVYEYEQPFLDFYPCKGGGWCQNVDACLDRARSSNGSSAKLMSTQNGIVSFGGMLDANSTFNPDFYNWHVVKIFYCDGSSFMSDVEDVDPKYNLTYRGARIYDAMMDELLRIGMGNAKNVYFRYTFINTLKSTIENSSSRRGYFVHSCYQHGHMEYKRDSTCSSLVGNGLANKTIAQAVGDWFFDRSEFQEMDMPNDLPRNCTSFDDQPTLEKKLKVDLKECYKIWDDDCKFGLLKEICNDISDHPQNVCCGFLRNNRMDLDCYFAIVDDLKNNYSCQHPDVATGRASDILTDCQG